MVRVVAVDGQNWDAYVSGRVMVYGRDQFGLIFERGTGPQRIRRVTHYSPTGSRVLERSFTELSDRELLELFRQSQPAWTAPEVNYDAH
ncbi:MAG TPA: hypothetical protein VFO67_00995 [Gemmatimonadales bacterium]|nr:hypothetical protein [Gemmatimonadales bacterium]